MTWKAAIMPDDALPPDSLIGSILNPTSNSDQIRSSEPPPATVEPMPLWRVMNDAWAESDWTERQGAAAEIEALGDWLPKIPPAEFFSALGLDGREEPKQIARCTMDWVRALLTEQARLARGADPH